MKDYKTGGSEGRPAPKDGWRTPRELYDRLDAEFRFTLDAACSRANCLAPRGLYADQGINAFTCGSWYVLAYAGRPGAVWLNPPYSDVRPWLLKARETGKLCPVVCLVPCDTSTRWWRDLVAGDAHEVRFLIGRVRFLDPETGAEHRTRRSGGGTTTPSALVVYSPASGPPRYSYVESRVKRQAALVYVPPAAVEGIDQ